MSEFLIPDRLSNRTALRWKRTLGIVFALGFLVRLAVMIFTPLHPETGMLPAYKEEPAHLRYIEYITRTASLPKYDRSLSEVDVLARKFDQPPIYYTLAVPFYFITEKMSTGWGIYGVRFLSVLCGLLAAAITYRTALVWSGNLKLALSAATAMLFAPMAVISTSLVTNDALLIAGAALVIYFVVLSQYQVNNITNQILTGVMIGLSAWVKVSALALIPLALLVGSHKDSLTQMAVAKLRTILVMSAIIMPLLMWNASVTGSVIVKDQVSASNDLVHSAKPETQSFFQKGMTFMHSAAMPWTDKWGVPNEKTASLIWVIIWGGTAILGFVLFIVQKPHGITYITAVFLVLVSIRVFFSDWADFRVVAAALPALAVSSAGVASLIRISPLLQAALWIAPFIVVLVV